MFFFFLAIMTVLVIAYLWALGNVLKERRTLAQRHGVEEEYFNGRAIPPHLEHHNHGHDDHHDHH